MSNNPDYKSFIELCSKMSEDLNEVPSPEVDFSLEEWDSITRRAVKSMKENLYALSNDKQRKFFLVDVFESIFHELNNIFYLISSEYLFNESKIQGNADRIIDDRNDNLNFELEPECYILPWDRYFLHSKSRDYIDRCSLNVFKFTSDLADLCYEYEIKFEEIVDSVMIWNNVSNGDIRHFYHYKVSSGGYMVMGEYEPPGQPVMKEAVKVIPLNPGSKVKLDIEFSDIFYNQYKDNYMDFFEELKKEKFGFINSDNKWKNDTRAHQFFKFLQKPEIKVIRETLPDGRKIKDTMVKVFFQEVFGVEPDSFRTSRTVLSPQNGELFEKAIQSVKSTLSR